MAKKPRQNGVPGIFDMYQLCCGLPGCRRRLFLSKNGVPEILQRCINSFEVFPAAAGALLSAKTAILSSVTCIRLGEVFPAATGAFFSPPKTIPEFSDMY